MQSVSSRIWTRVAVSISYDDNDYTTDTSTNEQIYKRYVVWVLNFVLCTFYLYVLARFYNAYLRVTLRE